MLKCVFTGHRPEKLSFGNNESHPDCVRLKQRLFDEILRMTGKGVRVFLSGMARGIDMWAAEAVLEIQDAMPDKAIELWAAIPYERQPNGWSEEQQARYRYILTRAKRIEYISREYTRGCLHQRDRWMVNQATHLLGVYNGQPGGTRNTIDYAEKKGLDITIIKP